MNANVANIKLGYDVGKKFLFWPNFLPYTGCKVCRYGSLINITPLRKKDNRVFAMLFAKDAFPLINEIICQRERKENCFRMNGHIFDANSVPSLPIYEVLHLHVLANRTD